MVGQRETQARPGQLMERGGWIHLGNQGKLFRRWRPKTRLLSRAVFKWAFTFVLPLPSCETLANQSPSCAVPSAAQQAATHK